MSEETVVAAPEPVAEPVVEAPEAVVEAVVEETAEAPKTLEDVAIESAEKNAPRTRRERRTAVRERLATAQAERPRDETGKFISQEPGATEEEAPLEADAADVAPESVDDPAAVTAEEVVSIELDPSNPLYDQGMKSLDGVPKHLERAVRTMVAATARKREVSETRVALDAQQEENVRLKARLEAYEAGIGNTQTPEVQQLLAQVKEHYPEQYELVKEGIEAKAAAEAMGRENAAVAEATRTTQARSFLTEVGKEAPAKYPVWTKSGELGNRMSLAAQQYADYVDGRNAQLQGQGRPEVSPSTREFFAWVDTNYVSDQRVKDQLVAFDKQRVDKRVETEAKRRVAEERNRLAAEEKANLKEAATRHSGKPPMPPNVSTHGRAAPPERPVAHGTRQKELRANIRERLKGRS